MQALNFLIAAGSFLLLLFSLHLFFAKHGNRLLNRLLSVIFFARSGQIAVFLLMSSGELNIFPYFQQLFTPFYYAAPACFYLYITGFINDRSSIKKIELLHFIPVALAIIYGVMAAIDCYQLGGNCIQIIKNKQVLISQKNGLFPPYFYRLARPVLLIGYLCAAWHAVLTSPVMKEKLLDNVGKVWILFLLRVATFFQLIGFLPLIFGGLVASLENYSWFIALNCTLLIFVIVFVLHQPRLLYGYLFVSVNWKEKTDTSKKPLRVGPLKTNLLPDQLNAYKEAMKELMEIEKPFLLPDFQIIHLAQKLNMPLHHCSFVVNNVIGKNFRDWINAYRVHDFLMQYPLKSTKMTIESIAYESGFKSQATFYNAFKKETGLMPKAYFAEAKQLN